MLTGIVSPIQNTVNPALGVIGLIPIVGEIITPLDINLTGLLGSAAAGDPISLSVLDRSGTIIGPGSQCNTISDSYQLDTPAGIAIGGNRITGLGANGLDAVAGELGSIAFGNSATTAASATNAVAIGTGASVGAGATAGVALGDAASVTAANSVAIGAGSVAARGAQAGYVAVGLAAPQTSVGEVSVGSAGNARQITNVAAGSAPTDAVNVSQLAAVGSAAVNAVQYDLDGGGTRTNTVTLAGGAAGPVTVTNVAPSALSATSTDAVNGGQLFATNGQVTTNTTNIATNTTNIAGNTTNITNLTNGTAGTVQRTAVADALALTAVGGSGVAPGTPQSLGNVAAGALGASSTDAVNGSQLFATNSQVTTNTTNVAGNTTNITNLTNGTTGLVRQVGGAPGSGQITVGAETAGTSVSVAGTAGNRTVAGVAAGVAATDAVNVGQLGAVGALASNSVQYDLDGLGNRLNSATLVGGAAGPVVLGNVAAGTLDATSTQAVNGSQLFATNTQVTTNTTNIATNTANIATNTTNIAGATTSITALNNGTAGTVQRTATPNTLALTAPGGTGAAPGAPQVLGNVASGVATTDAVNVGQLEAISTSVANVVQYDVDGLGNRLNSATLIGGAAGPVVIGNVAAGVLDATSAQAVNGSQLFATNANVAAASLAAANANLGVTGVTGVLGGSYDPATRTYTGPTYNTVGATTATTVQGAFDNYNSAIAGLSGGSLGLVQQVGGAPGSGLITVGAATGGAAVSVAGTAGTRTIQGVSAGVAATDAANVGQLAAVGDVAGNSVQYDRDGDGNRINSVTLVGGAAGPVVVTNVAAGTLSASSSDAVNGAQLFATNTNVTNNTTAITSLTTTINNGSVGPVQRAPGADTLALVAAGGTGAAPGNAQLLGNVAAGTVAADSTQAVNGSQLFATNTNVAAATAAAANANSGVTGVATVVGGTYDPATGTYTGPTYNTVGGTTATTVQGAFNNYNGAIAGLSNGTIGLVQQATPTAPITVGATSSGTVVDVTGNAGTRTVTGVSAGAVTATSSDAVNGSQLFATNTNVTTAQTTATNAGNGVAAVAAALGGGAGYDTATGVSTAPSYTIQGATYTTVAGALGALDGAVGGAGQAAPFRGNNTANRPMAVASGANATAGGFGAVASGASSLALGTNATSSGVNSVALGAGSSDGGLANVVSVGGVGSERRITNVANAVNATDAVNLGQATALSNSALSQANSYTDVRIGALGFDLSRRIDQAGASAAALAGVPQAIQPGRSFAGAAIGGRGNAVSLAFGLSTILTDDHNMIFKAGVALNTTGGYATYNAGVGFHF
ncbi:beta strand repeat-containing protein [Sandarakinorhabdus sp. DWP1-3-1]|uniref:beta strand repeat-containing protein n=1 Tax=Sandarakinorhabdus sp. DWP1-3-1 TaxID=2804627 RepID=UPI003CF25651